jgi:UDP-N-acetylmuramoylalanine--D-glutamate ligase
MALRALGKKIILICGGTDKGLDMSKLVAEIPRYCKGLVLLRESGTEKIQNSKGKMQKLNSKLKIEDGENLRECVRKAMKSAKKDDIILFSPAFASFGKWFKNEYDRNDQFVKVVEKLR